MEKEEPKQQAKKALKFSLKPKTDTFKDWDL